MRSLRRQGAGTSWELKMDGSTPEYSQRFGRASESPGECLQLGPEAVKHEQLSEASIFAIGQMLLEAAFLGLLFETNAGVLKAQKTG